MMGFGHCMSATHGDSIKTLTKIKMKGSKESAIFQAGKNVHVCSRVFRAPGKTLPHPILQRRQAQHGTKGTKPAEARGDA